TKNIKSGDIFVIIDLPPNKPFKTKLFKGPDPKFNEKFRLDLMTFQDDELLLTVKEQKQGGSKFIGQVQIPIKAYDLPQGPNWYFLTDRPIKGPGQKPKVVTGQIQIQFTFVHRLLKSKSRHSIPFKEFEQFENEHKVNQPPIQVHQQSHSSHHLPPIQNKLMSKSPSNSSLSSSSSGCSSPEVDGASLLSSSNSEVLEVRGGEKSGVNNSQQQPFIGRALMNETINSQSPIDYTREEAVIIEETLKTKENQVKKQIQQQKNIIQKLNETIKVHEKEGKPLASIQHEKQKVKKMQDDMEELEKLLSTTQQQHPVQPLPPSSPLINSSSSTPTPSHSTISKRSSMYNTLNKIEGTTNKSKIDISKFNFQGSSSGSASVVSDDHQVQMLLLELENEKKLKETLTEKNRILIKDNEKFEKLLDSSQRDLNKMHKENDELSIKVKLVEADNQSLVKEKEILNEKFKLFQRESDKLEKELDYELSLKRKQSEKKDKQKEESKRLMKELDQSQNKLKILQIELDNQRELNDMIKDKKLSLEKEIQRLDSTVKGTTTTQIINNNDTIKLKNLEIDYESIKRSNQLSLDKIKLVEGENDKLLKNISRLETEIKRLEALLHTSEKTNDKLIQQQDKIQLDNKSNQSLLKLTEDKFNEMIKILLNFTSNNNTQPLVIKDSALSKSIQDITQKIQSQNLKNKEMELSLAEIKSKKIQSFIQRQQQNPNMISDDSDDEPLDQQDHIHSSTSSMMASGLLQQQNDQISILVNKLEKLDKLEDLMRRLENMKLNSSMDGTSSVNGKRSYQDIKSELESIQKVIMNDSESEKVREDANIKFEKIYQELIQTDEYKKEIQQIDEEKRKVNEPLNQKALQKLLSVYTTANIEKSQELKDKIKENPELLLIGMDPKLISSKHQNDFQQYYLRSCNIEELRAIRASLPKWRPDQKKQQDWTQTLEDKIEQLSKKPQIQKPKSTLNLKKPPSNPNSKYKPSQTLPLKKQLPTSSNNNGGNPLFSELLKKRSIVT
ncbi:hypothetical protein DLAC_05116, partial [Tieghemostelium lacteum]